jgi:hypothetical protein
MVIFEKEKIASDYVSRCRQAPLKPFKTLEGKIKERVPACLTQCLNPFETIQIDLVQEA